MIPNLEPGAHGLYISVGTSEYSGLIRNPHNTPLEIANSLYLLYWFNELKVI